MDRAAARSRPTAWRTSARSKKRSAPLTANGTPASLSACSNSGVCALVRTSTAMSRGAVPDRISSAARRATAAASSCSSPYSVNSGSGPGGRWAVSAASPGRGAGTLGPPAEPRPGVPRRLASAITWGVDR